MPTFTADLAGNYVIQLVVTDAAGLVSVPATEILNSTAQIASFVPDLAGTYVVQLIVNDGVQNSLPATAEIQVVTPQAQLT
jgi:hypothetical protein